MKDQGVSAWRQIGDTLAGEIQQGVVGVGQRLPSSIDLAARFGVNRHTVLRAVAHLQSGGFVRIERGRGTYAVVNPIQFRLGRQRWFEENLIQANKLPSRRVLSVAVLPAPEKVADALQIAAGVHVALVILVGEADGFPINYGVNYISLERLPGVDGVFRNFGSGPTGELSFSKIFASLGVPSYRRKSVRIRSRPPRPEEARHLEIAPSDHVLETEVTLVDPADAPLVLGNTSYPSSRAELVMDL